MSLMRLQRVQAQLQSHQSWLRAFVASQSPPSIRKFEVTRWNTRAFSTPSSKEQQEASPLKSFRKKHKSSSKSKRKTKSDGDRIVKPEILSHRADLLEAIGDDDLTTAISMYAILPEKKPLTSHDTQSLAQLVNHALRTEMFKPRQDRKQDDVDEIVAFATQMMKDIRNDNLMPNTRAHVHLLATLKESDNRDVGIDFWKWLEDQDSDHTNLEVYAVAIELLAINGTPLPELERLYQTGLSRFPGTFSAYHLSPDAVLPDREQKVNFTVPSTLLKSITYARLLHGDSRNAYLALDTMLRLYPTTLSPYFLQMFLKERPISEAYTVWAMACRAGNTMRSSDFKSFLARIRTSSDLTSADSHVATLRIMVATMYLYLGSGGPLVSNSVSELVIAMTQVLRIPSLLSLPTAQRQSLVSLVWKAVGHSMVLFARYGAMASQSAFNSIIVNVAGFGQVQDVIRVALADMEKLGLKQNAVTRRSILTAAGQLRDARLVEKTWDDIVSAQASLGMPPDISDWNVLVKAVNTAGNPSFAQDQFDALERQLPDTFQALIQHRLHSGFSERNESLIDSPSEAQFAKILDKMERLVADLTITEERTRETPEVQDFSKKVVPMTIIQTGCTVALPEFEMGKLYEELTTDSSSQALNPQTASSASPASGSREPAPASRPISSTGLSFGTLRYENWKCMNYLLWLAGEHDQAYEKVVDQAIAAGRRPPMRHVALSTQELEDVKNFGLSDADSPEVEYSEEHVKQARWEIFNLRRNDTTT